MDYHYEYLLDAASSARVAGKTAYAAWLTAMADLAAGSPRGRIWLDRVI